MFPTWWTQAPSNYAFSLILHISVPPFLYLPQFLASCFPSAALPLSINVLLDEKCEGQTHIISVLMEASHSCLTLLLLRLLLDFACLKVAYGILSDCWTRWPPTQQCASISPSLTAPLWALQQLFSPVPPLPWYCAEPHPSAFYFTQPHFSDVHCRDGSGLAVGERRAVESGRHSH